MSNSSVIAVVGPTACGKSELAFALAQRLDAEIVSVDSVQVYKGLDIGTSKPPKHWRDAIPHHMIDVLPLSEPTSAGWYKKEAAKALETVASRGRPAILVGGSSLYYFALTTQLPLFPKSAGTRQWLEDRARKEGLGPLVAELSAIAPEVAQFIDLRNPRRVIRALEIASARLRSGNGADGWYRGIAQYCHKGTNLVGIGLSVPREILRRRIHERATRMIDEGLVEEVKSLFFDEATTPSPSVSTAVGYRQVLECLRNGAGRNEMIESVACATWKLARRQRAWFRRDRRLCWFSSGNPLELVDAVERYVKRRLSEMREHAGPLIQESTRPSLVAHNG